MAIDPATAKVLVQAATKIITDKDTRNKLLYIILIAISCGVVVLLTPIYILTQPFEMLSFAFESPEEAALIEQYKKENDDKVLIFGSDLITDGKYPLPVKDARISSPFGSRTDPITGKPSFHTGTDFAAAWCSPIYAVADGVVVKANTNKSSYGNYLMIQHTGTYTKDDGTTETETFYAIYAHMHELYLFEGQSVMQGAVIGLVGGDPDRDTNPGDSTGPHLHFEIRENMSGPAISPDGFIFSSSDSGQLKSENRKGDS
ncbi:M23 family metallopeptidase [Fumia xinanensis]|uniref:M23 family metallopeptidase n=1 Tax=Fumia xinanensis TaxID=2763659 RepID=A0A926E7S1_9FIRM|nr:M23 family metallopeptidase [Fumia xinanensis]MBC8560741.1 M23 family metallopeptidase [Fumia xinanensis]